MNAGFLSCGLAAALAVAVPLQATTIDLGVDPLSGSTGNTGSTARISLSFGSLGADDLLIISIRNTTPESVGSKLTAVGLELPDLLSLTIDFTPEGRSAYFDTLTFKTSVSPGWMDAPGGYDLMITSDGKFEGGSPRGAPAAGETQAVTLTLGATSLMPGQLLAVFQDYYASASDNYLIARFQSVGVDGELSDKVLGKVPAPGSMALVGLGALAALRRRPTR